MAICSNCGSYYRLSKFNCSQQCEVCYGYQDVDFNDLDEEDKLDLDRIVNPSEKTPARFYED